MNVVHISSGFAISIVALTLSACGFDGDEKKSEPPPVTAGQSQDTFALESGTYYVTELRALQDGCKKKPMDGSDPLTQVPFTLTNDGNGNITLDFCSYEQSSIHGVVRGNAGTISVIHSNRKNGAAVFDQECRIDLTTTKDNDFRGRYTETQRNRNAALQQASKLFESECTTAFDFSMKKRD